MKLPAEIWNVILSYLCSMPIHLANIEQTCSWLHKLVNHENYWHVVLKYNGFEIPNDVDLKKFAKSIYPGWKSVPDGCVPKFLQEQENVKVKSKHF